MPITLPTTRYLGRDIPPSATAADQASLIPQHAHWPLVFMLILTQAGVGLLMSARGNAALTLTGTVIFFSGMGASVFHLGQPLKAWRFFLGLRTSWLSREILAFSLFAPLPVIHTTFVLLPYFPQLPIPALIVELLPLASQITQLCTIAVCGVAVFTSVMIYHDTRRSLWRFPRGASRFFGTVASFAALGNFITHPTLVTGFIFTAAVILKMIPELRFLKLGEDPDAAWSPDAHSTRLQLGPLGPFLRARFALAVIALSVAAAQPWFALLLLLLAELFERQIYFQSVQAPKMPGNFCPTHRH